VKYRSEYVIHVTSFTPTVLYFSSPQHYAALGRDLEGGASVNLVDAPSPGDVYTAVSRIVKQRVEEEAEAGSEEAALLMGQIDRKLVKQTVMTSVYGVTRYGAADQVRDFHRISFFFSLLYYTVFCIIL
jgi:DNA-directed RNA polymerase